MDAWARASGWPPQDRPCGCLGARAAAAVGRWGRRATGARRLFGRAAPCARRARLTLLYNGYCWAGAGLLNWLLGTGRSVLHGMQTAARRLARFVDLRARICTSTRSLVLPPLYVRARACILSVQSMTNTRRIVPPRLLLPRFLSYCCRPCRHGAPRRAVPLPREVALTRRGGRRRPRAGREGAVARSPCSPIF